MAGGSHPRHALDGIGEIAALRAGRTRHVIVIGGAATQQSADRRAKLRHTGEG